MTEVAPFLAATDLCRGLTIWSILTDLVDCKLLDLEAKWDSPAPIHLRHPKALFLLSASLASLLFNNSQGCSILLLMLAFTEAGAFECIEAGEHHPPQMQGLGSGKYTLSIQDALQRERSVQ